MDEQTKYYLGLDENNYLTYISTVGTGPYIESIDGYDFSGYRLQAHKWDGETLTFDPARYAELAQHEAQEQAQEQIRALTSRLHQTDDVVLEALEGLMSATTMTGFIAALVSAAKDAKAVLAERNHIRQKIQELQGE